MLQNQVRRGEPGAKILMLQNALIKSYVQLHALKEDKAALKTSLVELANNELKVCQCVPVA